MNKGLTIGALFIILLSLSCSTETNNAGNQSLPVDVETNDSIKEYVQNHAADTNLMPTPNFGYPFIESFNEDVTVEDVANYLLKRLQERNLLAISALTHDELPVKISPKVRLDSNTFSIDGKLFSKLALTNETIRWYGMMASGEPLELNFEDYWDQYVWNKDYSKAILTFNKFENRSSVENNIKSHFPDCDIVEAFLKGDQELSWQSLILVFKVHEGKHYLVGLIHDQHEI